jgi:tetratricopeptide (TPR) repeat protein
MPENKIDALLQIRPSVWQLLRLPWWYPTQVVHMRDVQKNAIKEVQPGPFCIEHTCLLSAHFGDRNYLDTVLDRIECRIETGQEKHWIQAFCDVGLTLYDLGYRDDGIRYLEKAIDLEQRPNSKHHLKRQLGFRLNDSESWQKRLQLAQALVTEDPDDTNAKALLAKACIDLETFEEAQRTVEELMKDYPRAYGFLLAELYFAQRNFASAASAFERYEIPWVLHFWLAQHHYRKGIAFYYTAQEGRWREQALKIKRRLLWDRFYNLNDLEDAGIERIPAMDEVIESKESDKILIDTEKAAHYLRAICHMMRLHFWKDQFTLLVLFFVGIYFFVLVLLRLVGRWL